MQYHKHNHAQFSITNLNSIWKMIYTQRLPLNVTLSVTKVTEHAFAISLSCVQVITSSLLKTKALFVMYIE